MNLPAFQLQHAAAQEAGHFTPYPEPTTMNQAQYDRRYVELLRSLTELNAKRERQARARSKALIYATLAIVSIPAIAAILCKIFLP